MIKRLQKKFIVVSMLSTLLVLMIIIGLINLLNYQKIVADADRVLHILSDHNGHFPQNPPSPQKETDIPPQPSLPETLFSKNMSPEIPYESRYFSAVFQQDGTLLSLDTGKIAAIDTDTASDYAIKVWNNGRDKGFFLDYRYLRYVSEDGTRLIFLDCGRSLSTFRSFLYSSILVSFLGLAAVLFLVVVFSKIVMTPVSESYEKQRRFITDAGHEIKTPLTIIDANAEILEMEYGENEWILGIQKQTKRLASLTNDLIYLSRMEEHSAVFQTTDFSFSDLLEESLLSFQALAEKQQKSFYSQITPLLSFRGDVSAICQLISILLDNSLKYSSPHSVIDVKLLKKGKHLLFSVSNPVTDISKEDLPHLFDRFYRADSSHNSETGGYGIGLSIAKAVAESHKGKITLHLEEDHFFQITVKFPCP